MMDIVVFVSLLATAFGAYYAKKAADSTKEISYPSRNPRSCYRLINHHSKEARKFEAFIARNVDRKIYLNVYFDGRDFSEFITLPSLDEGGSITIKTLGENASEREMIRYGSDHFNLYIINNDSDARLGWSTGNFILKGYFCVVGYGGPKHGGTAATLRPVNINS